MKKSTLIFLITFVCALLIGGYFFWNGFGSSLNVEEAYKLIPVQLKEDGKISLINFNGEVILEDEFSKESDIFYSEGVIKEEKDNAVKYYVIDGKKTIQIADGIKILEGTPFVNGYAVIRKENGMLALINKKGEQSIENLSLVNKVKIIGAGVVSDGLIRVKNNEGLWGYITTKGEFKIEPSYAKCENFNNGKARVVKSDGLLYIINKDGKEIFTGKEDVNYYPFSEDLMCFYESSKSSDDVAVGFVDIKNDKIIKDAKFYYRNANHASYIFKNGTAVISGEDNDSWGVINKKGDIVGDLKPKYETEPIIANDGSIFINDKKDKKCKIFNSKGEEIKKIEDYSFVFPLASNRYIAIKELDDQKKVSLIDNEGRDVAKNLDRFYMNTRLYLDLINNNTDYLNGLYIKSTYFDFDAIYSDVFKSISYTGILDVTQASNISSILNKWPYNNDNKLNNKSISNVSRYNDYSIRMASKKVENSSKNNETADSPSIDTTSISSSLNDQYPYITSTFYQPKTRTFDVISYNLAFVFNDYLKTPQYSIDPIYGWQTLSGYTINDNPKLIRIDFQLTYPSEVEYAQFMKQFIKKIESLNWNKDSDGRYTNTSNTNVIVVGDQGFSMYFPENEMMSAPPVDFVD